VDATAVVALSTTHPNTPRRDGAAHAARRQQVKRAIRERVRRIPGYLLVLLLLLPLLITALCGSR
jgi:hypothetical protein